MPAPRVATGAALHSCSSMGIRPCGHTCPPLDDHDDIVELDFADTSALSDVGASERWRLNGRTMRRNT